MYIYHRKSRPSFDPRCVTYTYRVFDRLQTSGMFDRLMETWVCTLRHTICIAKNLKRICRGIYYTNYLLCPSKVILNMRIWKLTHRSLPSIMYVRQNLSINTSLTLFNATPCFIPYFFPFEMSDFRSSFNAFCVRGKYYDLMRSRRDWVAPNKTHDLFPLDRNSRTADIAKIGEKYNPSSICVLL